MDQVLITNIFLVIVGSFIVLLTLALLFIAYQVYRLTRTIRGIIDNAASEVKRAQNIIGFFGKKLFPNIDMHEKTTHHRKEKTDTQ